MTNLTPTTELKFAPWPTKEDAWYCVIINNIDHGYVYGSPEDAKKYQDMLRENHDSEFNFPYLDLVEEPELLAELENQERADQTLIETEIEHLQEWMDDKAQQLIDDKASDLFYGSF